MENMTELAERFTAIGKAWTKLLKACEEEDIEMAIICQGFITGYLAGLMKDGIVTYEEKQRFCEEMQSQISSIM